MALAAAQAWAWKPVFVGHRGCYKGVMNTAEAYRNGVDVYGYAGLECDVRVTKDGAYVISHDESTSGVGGSLTVADATLAELQAETYTQTRGGVTYTGHICTVAEYLDICKEKGAFPVIELKWTTGINNNDMSNFPGLAQLIIDKGLADKVVILTSMKTSLEYVKTNYPQFQCQWLCSTNWDGNQEWCQKWGFTPSIEVGDFDIYSTKSYHDVGLDCAAWTVNSLATYKSVGAMGVKMITCDYLVPSDMPELSDVDWDNIEPVLDPLELNVDTVYMYSRANGNLPTNFPSGVSTESTRTSAQVAAIKDGVFYVNNYTTSELITYDETGEIENAFNGKGTNSHGICFDDAGNLIQRADGITKTPNLMIIYRNGNPADSVHVSFSLNEPGQTNFITASGDVMSESGGYVYFFPNGQTVMNAVKIAEGKLVEVTTSGNLSITSSTAGVIYPINGTQQFVYQVRGNGYYLYNKEDKGAYVASSASTTAPARNSSVGGAYFVLNGHKLLLHGSGTNYNGGFTIKDMSANKSSIFTQPVLGTGGYSANPTTGAWYKVDPIDETHCWLYEYCMGNGYAKYQLYVGEPYDPTVPTAVTDVKTNTTVKARKVLENGQIYILVGDKKYNLMGVEVK